MLDSQLNSQVQDGFTHIWELVLGASVLLLMASHLLVGYIDFLHGVWVQDSKRAQIEATSSLEAYTLELTQPHFRHNWLVEGSHEVSIASRDGGKKFYFSVRGIIKCCSYIFQFVEYFKVMIMKMMRVMMILKYQVFTISSVQSDLSIYNSQKKYELGDIIILNL